MNDIEKQKIVPCDSNSTFKFYFNFTNNVTICFKYDYPCPKE